MVSVINVSILVVLCLLSVGAWQPSQVATVIPLRPLRTNIWKHPSYMKMTSDSFGLASVEKAGNAAPWMERIDALYKFSRPHTIKGTILASVMGVSRALLENPEKINFALLPKAAAGLLALLFGNAFIVGINQIYDVQIDKINKPFLPIAAQTMSENSAWSIIFVCLLSGVSIVKKMFSDQIMQLYLIGVFLGTIYSVPPIQLKRVPLFAGSIIAIVRGFLLNFGVYYAVREALSIPFQWNPVVLFISLFMTVFASVIAVTKDLPDVEGDKKYNISTLASKFGVKSIALSSVLVLNAAYLTAIALPILKPQSFRASTMIGGHTMALLYLWRIYGELVPSEMGSIKKFYKSIWNLFYWEYVLYPFI